MFFFQGGNRIFHRKGKSYTLGKATVNYLRAYNTSSAFSHCEKYDKIFVNVLLVSFVNVKMLKNFELDKHAMDLIKAISCKLEIE